MTKQNEAEEASSPKGGETIYAIASGAGRAAIAVLRLSGPATRWIVKTLVARELEPRKAHLVSFIDPAGGEPIDRGLALFFPGPRSFTGEDCAEFHVHGGRAVIAALVKAVASVDGTRPAEPGEFTRRALFNSKMDLAQVEGLADLVAAETEQQRRRALRQLDGVFGKRTALWREALLEAAALLEAEIDFSDEEDVPTSISSRVGLLLEPVRANLEAELAGARAGERIREGVIIVLAGPPNAGKSTLLNALAKRDVAIVSPEAGTTRDALEVHLDLHGCAVTLIDTAGLRESANAVEKIGMARAREKARSADLVLWLSEAAAPTAPEGLIEGAEVWPILTKSDLQSAPAGAEGLSLSAASGENLNLLIDKIADFAMSCTAGGHGALITRERHRKAFAMAEQALSRLLANLDGPVELLAEDLRAALFALQRITGVVDVEDILGEIFSRFCIGK